MHIRLQYVFFQALIPLIVACGLILVHGYKSGLCKNEVQQSQEARNGNKQIKIHFFTDV